jgi:hypothetical protein
VPLVCERTIPTEWPPYVGEVSASFCGHKLSFGRLNGSSRPYSRFSRAQLILFLSCSSWVITRGWVDPVPDPLILRKSGSTRNRIRDLWICSRELWPLDHRGCQEVWLKQRYNMLKKSKRGQENRGVNEMRNEYRRLDEEKWNRNGWGGLRTIGHMNKDVKGLWERERK